MSPATCLLLCFHNAFMGVVCICIRTCPPPACLPVGSQCFHGGDRYSTTRRCNFKKHLLWDKPLQKAPFQMRRASTACPTPPKEAL